MIANPNVHSTPTQGPPGPTMSWRSFVWLAVRCVAAAIFSSLAVVLVAVGVEAGFADPQSQVAAALNGWLDPEMRFTSLWGRLAATSTSLVPKCAVAIVLAIDHFHRIAQSGERASVSIRWRLWLAGLLSSAACWIVALVVLDALARLHPGVVATNWNASLAENWLVYGLLAFFVVALAALAEEVIFRGALPSRLRDLGFAPIAAVLVSSAGFALIHESLDPMRLTQLGVGALAFSWTVHRLGRLEFAVGAHTAWNLAIYVWNARSLEILNGSPALTANSTAEWSVLIVMASTPALLAEVWVRTADRRPGT